MSRYIKGKPDFADCEKCSRTYGTLGCCSTVSNEWVYSCLEGMLEKAYTDGIKSVEPKRGKWIPCSKKMPNEGDRIVVQYADGSLGLINSCRMRIWNILDSPYSKVVAWMHIDPWKGADDE